MAKGDFKADPREIIRAHRRTYADARTHRPSWRDRLTFEGLPLATLGLCLGLNVRLPSAASVGLLTVAGLLGTLLFGVLVELSTRAMDMADDSPEQGSATSQHAIFIGELAANTAYASLMCIFAAVVFVVASVGTHWVLRISSAIGLALGIHVVLVLMMVMKRVFALTIQRLTRARTGADRPSKISRLVNEIYHLTLVAQLLRSQRLSMAGAPRVRISGVGAAARHHRKFANPHLSIYPNSVGLYAE